MSDEVVVRWKIKKSTKTFLYDLAERVVKEGGNNGVQKLLDGIADKEIAANFLSVTEKDGIVAHASYLSVRVGGESHVQTEEVVGDEF